MDGVVMAHLLCTTFSTMARPCNALFPPLKRSARKTAADH